MYSIDFSRPRIEAIKTVPGQSEERAELEAGTEGTGVCNFEGEIFTSDVPNLLLECKSKVFKKPAACKKPAAAEEASTSEEALAESEKEDSEESETEEDSEKEEETKKETEISVPPRSATGIGMHQVDKQDWNALQLLIN